MATAIMATADYTGYPDRPQASRARLPPAVCRARDPKGLWAMVDRGQIHDLPGADAVYEAPAAPEVTVRSDLQPVGVAADEVVVALERQGFI